MAVILVPTADRPECAFALEVAFDLAAALDAQVAGCHVRPARREPLTTLRARVRSDRGVGEWPEGEPIDSAAARQLFAAAAKQHDFSIVRRFAPRRRRRAVWHELVGTPARVLGIAGPLADFSVASRPQARSRGRARAFLLAALLDTARPVLVVPQRRLRHLARRVIIAWNQSPEAAAAVSAAMPLLQRAERVVIVSCGAENRPGPKSSQLVQYLATFDVQADCVRARGLDAEREIRKVYRDTDADLVVMGAYSRSRLRELLFGGVTEHMLFETDIPVFMLHR